MTNRNWTMDNVNTVVSQMIESGAAAPVPTPDGSRRLKVARVGGALLANILSGCCKPRADGILPGSVVIGVMRFGSGDVVLQVWNSAFDEVPISGVLPEILIETKDAGP